MSQLSSQLGLVANRALSLPTGPSTGFTLEQRDRARLIIDTARAQSETGQRTAGLVGQGAARTGQLLNAPLTPGVRTASSSPVATNPLQEALGALDAGMNAPTLLQQFGGGPISTQDAGQLILESRREFQSRSSDVSIIRRARLRQDILDQQVAERREARVERADIRSELSQQLSFDREARISRTAETMARTSLTSVLTEQLRTVKIDRKNFGKLMTSLGRGGPLPPEKVLRQALAGLGSQGDLLRDRFTVMSRILEAERQDPGSADGIMVKLSAPPKATAAERKVEEKEQRALEITRKILSLETLTGEFRAVVEDEILDLAVETISEASGIQLQLDRINPRLARRFETLRLRLSTSGASTAGPNSLSEVQRRARAEAELNF